MNEQEPAKRVPNRAARRKGGWKKHAKAGYRRRAALHAAAPELPWRLHSNSAGKTSNSDAPDKPDDKPNGVV